MKQIILRKVGFGYAKPLFSDIDLTISEGERIGIVGNNGEGKSTLIKCMAGGLPDHQGQLILPRGFTAAFIEQAVPADIKDKTLYDAIADKIPESERPYSQWRVDMALDAFKAPADLRDKPVSALSGGWQRLALLARASMTDPDFLFLDEPTNHLDVEKITVLEDWLNTQMRGKCIVTVSHDRRFLDTCTDRTLFLRGGHVHDYAAPYTRARSLLMEDDKADSAQREREMIHIDRLQKHAHALRQTGANDHSELAQKKAKQLEQRVEKLKSHMTEVHVETRRDIRLNSSDTSARRLLSMENVDIAAPDGRHLFHIDKLEVRQGERLVILGHNGAGKSQFVQHLNRAFARRDAAREEGISVSPTLLPGYIDQHLSNLPAASMLHEYVRTLAPMDHERAAGLLVSAGFPYKEHQKKISNLSEGEKSRLNLLALRLEQPNFYVMDEPTNHLDIAGQESLESEIRQQGAAGILVSHDRAFVSNIASRFMMISKGRIREVETPDVYYQSADATDAVPEKAGKKGRQPRG